MLYDLFRYSGSTTKLKAMKRKQLEPDDYREMANMSSVPQVIGYLKDHSSYRDILADVNEREVHRGEIELLLNRAIRNDFLKIYRFMTGDQRGFLEVYTQRFEVAIIKASLYQLYDHQENTVTLEEIQNDFFLRHTKLDVEALIKASNVTEFLSGLSGTEYHDALAHTMETGGTLFDIEMRLNLFYYGKVWRAIEKKLHGKDQTALRQAFGTEMDLVNLSWIYRFRTVYQSPDYQIYSFLVPYGNRLKPSMLSQMVKAESVDEFVRLVDETPYSGLFQNPSRLEKAQYEYQLHNERTLLMKYPLSILAVTVSIHEKETELRNIIAVTEGVRYGLEADDILSRLIV